MLPRPSAIKAELCRRDYATFLSTVAPQLELTPFHRALASELTACVRTGGFYIFSSPPQLGKSQLISRNLASYIWANYPGDSIIHGAYGQDLVNGFSHDIKDSLKAPAYQGLYGIAPKYTDNKIDQWGTTAGGSYRCAGIQGGVTGNPGNWLIIDDPLKGYEAAKSPTAREKIWREYVNSFRSRVSPNSKGVYGIIIVATRWHPDDLIGRVLDRAKDPNADQPTVYRWPAILEECDVNAPDRHPMDERAVGEALWESRHSVVELNKRRALGEADFVTLYQGRPVSDARTSFGQSFPSLKTWFFVSQPAIATELAPKPIVVNAADGRDYTLANKLVTAQDMRSIRSTTLSIDCSFKKVAGADPVGMVVVSDLDPPRDLDESHRALLVRYAAGDDSHVLTAQETIDKAHRLISEYGCTKVLVEEAANGYEVIAQLTAKLGKHKVIVRPPGSGKVARANAVAELLRKVHVAHPDMDPQTSAWILEQLRNFPNVKHDDFTDALTHYLQWWAETYQTKRRNVFF